MASPLVLGAFPNVVAMPEDRMILVPVLRTMRYLERSQTTPFFHGLYLLQRPLPMTIRRSLVRIQVEGFLALFCYTRSICYGQSSKSLTWNSEIAEDNNRTKFMYKMMMASRISVALC